MRFPYPQNLDAGSLAEHGIWLRQAIVDMVYQAKSGHPGGSLSAIDLLNVLYHQIMRYDPQHPDHPHRDRFVLSKGHCSPALYAILADCGFFDRNQLSGFRKFGSPLQGHPSRLALPGVEVSTGSLGQGLSVAAGMALGLLGLGPRVYCLMGDGEQQEGQIWEAAMFAAHYRLNNLCALLDHNDLQIDGSVSQVMNIEPIDAKWAAFGWNVLHVNGHDLDAIRGVFEDAESCTARPTVLIARTIKGKGVSYMENQAGWHGAAPNEAQYRQAMDELAGGAVS